VNSLVIGVLALQGAFAKHAEMLRSLGVKVIEVRKPEELESCDGLVIPGGESTTMFKQMKFVDFVDPFRKFSQQKPVFGTCAGLILMSEKIIGDEMQPFHLIDVQVQRNAFGRQAESFQTEVDLQLPSKPIQQVPAIFIRAPKICQLGDQVNVLATLNGEPVLVRQSKHLGATFHPELTGNSTIHAFFLTLVRQKKMQ